MSHGFVPVKPFLDGGHHPAEVFARKGGEKWLTRVVPLLSAEENPWVWTVSGEHVRVPLFRYLTSNSDPAVAVAFFTSLGIQAYSQIADVPGQRRMHIAIGQPVEEEHQDGVTRFAFWLGIALEASG